MRNDYANIARQVIHTETEGLQALLPLFDREEYSKAIELMVNTKGRIMVSGMGKSGHIARKIAATLASTGTMASFIHPAEASHGDLGMISKDDIVVLLSNSGETKELADIIDYCKRFSITLIAIVRRKESTLVRAADIAFVLPNIEEASPVNAPTTSTTMMLGFGDAISITLLSLKGFTKQDFHIFHPGGKLGSQFTRVRDLMVIGDALPTVSLETPVGEVIIIMTNKSLGCAIVTDNHELRGIITDGDLRRHMKKNIIDLTAQEVMTKSPITVSADDYASEALAIMNERSVTSLCVVDQNKLCGVIHIHDLLRAGIG